MKDVFPVEPLRAAAGKVLAQEGVNALQEVMREKPYHKNVLCNEKKGFFGISEGEWHIL